MKKVKGLLIAIVIIACLIALIMFIFGGWLGAIVILALVAFCLYLAKKAKVIS